MNNPWTIGLMAWLIPGSGHLLKGRLKRGILIGAAIWIMFIIGLWSGGAFYPGYELKDGLLLHALNVFSRLGNGLGMLISLLVSSPNSANIAAWSTFEYGGKFLEVAGLLNFLAVFDAFDIAAGRKE